MNKQPESFDNTCRYAKLNGGDYEYGVIEVDKNGTKKHIKRGNAPTLDDALTANMMVLKGQDRIKGVFA